MNKQASIKQEKEDLAFISLLALESNLQGSALWLLEENWQTTFLPAKNASIITNRFDIFSRCKASHEHCFFQDFELIDNKYDAVFIRVSKDKLQTHHLINIATQMLAPEGNIYLAGYENEGYKSFIKRCQLAGFQVQSQRLKKGAFQATLTIDKYSEKLDDGNYAQLTTIVDEQDGETYFTKPGVYGWKKIDQGSALLIKNLKQHLEQNKTAFNTVLDLGCGFGYLAKQVAKLQPNIDITATDNNAAALKACEKNLSELISKKIIASDAGYEIQNKFDLIVCNPPFHQGFVTEKSLTETFIESAAWHLQQSGEAWFVLNSFIGFEKIARHYFQEISEIENNKSFKVFRCAL